MTAETELYRYLHQMDPDASLAVRAWSYYVQTCCRRTPVEGRLRVMWMK